jgi:hypothetical protein
MAFRARKSDEHRNHVGVTLPVTIHQDLRIQRSLLDRVRSRFRATGSARAVVDGHSFPCQRGAWATWIPALGAKFLNSMDGRLHCLHRIAPPRFEVLGPEHGEIDYGRYSRAEWQHAYTTPVSRRVAENVVAAQRLHAAGLGPRVLGLCIALRFRDGARADKCFAAGFQSEDVLRLPPKRPAEEAEFLAAGVSLDRLRSAIRQQVNGYVIDLNAAVGVLPVGAENEIAALEARINARVAETGWREA